MSQPYHVPAGTQRTETEVANSRFITQVAHAQSVEEARAFLAKVRAEMPDANHHVYAFRIGYGSSVTEGVSDDSEPTGTAGPPVLAVLRGTEIGDVIIVVTRYFGGVKLGTGGLVRAYSEAAHVAFNQLRTELKIARTLLGIDLHYTYFEQVKRLIAAHEGDLEDEIFADTVTLIVRLAVSAVPAFEAALTDLTAGQVTPVVLE